MANKQYLGNECFVECFVEFDGFAIVLTTENGVSVTNRIVLEPDVYNTLVKYVERLKSARTAGALTHP